MQRKLRTRFRAALASAVICVIASGVAHAVEVGQPAPDFTLMGSDGQSYTLSDLHGQHVVIAFFPKAFTGG